MTYIPDQLRRQVAERAGNRCEYCQSSEFVTGGPFHIEHVRPAARGGDSHLDNLACACARCNLHKGQRTHAIDPISRRSVALFNPRKQRWLTHCRWSLDGARIIGRTRAGRSTVMALKMNHPIIVQARSLWASCGIHPRDAVQ